MAPARSLHEIFAGLVGDDAARDDVAAVLAANGHPDLPPELLAQAVVSFADTAPVELAEHLASFVMAHGPVAEGPVPDDLDAPFDLLATAVAGTPDDAPLDAMPEIDGLAEPVDQAIGTAETVGGGPGGERTLDSAFGQGTGGSVDDIDTVVVEPAAGDVGPAGYAGSAEVSGVADLPDDAVPLPDDPWAMPSISDGAAEIDGIDAG